MPGQRLARVGPMTAMRATVRAPKAPPLSISSGLTSNEQGPCFEARSEPPRSIETKTYNALPEFLMIRECRVQIAQPGFRGKTIIIATTLLDADEFTKDDLAQLYRAPWGLCRSSSIRS
jgi:hypothetical protein